MHSIQKIESLLRTILEHLHLPWHDKITIEAPRDKKNGDIALNCALILAKEKGVNPRDLAQEIGKSLQDASTDIVKADIAGPGFVNITFSPDFWIKKILLVEEQGEAYGSSDFGAQEKVQVEFVSANPTGPLHVGHGRGAALGDSVARILRFAGYSVSSEYYINDAGNQMRILGLSVYLRCRELAGLPSEEYPADCYQGEYIIDMARDLLAKEADILKKEKEEAVSIAYKYALTIILEGIRKDLKDFRVVFNEWFSEQSLLDSGEVAKTLELLESKGLSYIHDGALWFASEQFGDDKDRVLRKADGSLTYFASDIAYHVNKFERGFHSLVDVWGADHHGYIPRMRSALLSLGYPATSFDVLLVQLVNWLREGKQISMSTRGGVYIPLAQVVEEVGPDAARFIFLSRKNDSTLDFDLELVKQRTMDNPVYYVQYAHARVCALLRRAAERDIVVDKKADLQIFEEQEAFDLLRSIDRFPLIVLDAARCRAPHFISYYLMDLAGVIHRYYSMHQILQEHDTQIVHSRLRLLSAAAQVIKNGLNLLGVDAPQAM